MLRTWQVWPTVCDVKQSLLLFGCGAGTLLLTTVQENSLATSVIPTVTMLAVHHFREGGTGEVVAARHPAVKFIVEAWNGGDFQNAHKVIAPDVEVYVNGLLAQSSHGGAALVKESIDYWRALIPDLEMEVLHECADGDVVGVHWQVSGTLRAGEPGVTPNGGEIAVEGSLFIKLEQGQVVATWTAFDGLSLVQQTGVTKPEPR